MSQADVDVVRQQFAATNDRDFARAMSYYAEDVELFVDPDSFLESGRAKGRDAVGRWFGNWLSTFEAGYHFEIEEARDLGEVVLLVAAHRGRGRSSGVEVHARTAYLYKVRDGKIVGVELYGDRKRALEAAGLQRRSDGGAT